MKLALLTHLLVVVVVVFVVFVVVCLELGPIDLVEQLLLVRETRGDSNQDTKAG